VAGVDVAADAAELLGLDWLAVEFDDDEQPARSSAAEATIPRLARQAAARVETCFMTFPFVNVRV
jgi:hypothetical protein